MQQAGHRKGKDAAQIFADADTSGMTIDRWAVAVDSFEDEVSSFDRWPAYEVGHVPSMNFALRACLKITFCARLQAGDRFWIVRASKDPQFCFAQKDSGQMEEPKKILRKHLMFQDGEVPFSVLSTLHSPQPGPSISTSADVLQQQNWPFDRSAASRREENTSQCSFGAQHLADVLSTAFVSLEDMEKGVNKANTKSEVFERVLFPDGDNSKVKLAERIAKCRPDAVTNANELLFWLVVSATEGNVAG